MIRDNDGASLSRANVIYTRVKQILRNHRCALTASNASAAIMVFSVISRGGDSEAAFNKRLLFRRTSISAIGRCAFAHGLPSAKPRRCTCTSNQHSICFGTAQKMSLPTKLESSLDKKKTRNYKHIVIIVERTSSVRLVQT